MTEPHRKYPGRDRVMSRDSARDYLWRRSLDVQDRLACERPFVLHAIGLPSQFEGGRPLPVDLENRCRQCDACLAHRRRLWTARAIDEIAIADRTWFGTLTASPESRLAIQWASEKRMLRPGGETFADLSPPERFRYLAAELGSEVTKYFKRLRTTGRFRYLQVFEAHKDGFPHAHVLLHEVAEPIRKSTLDAHWKFGFSKWKLVDQDQRAAVYVCKYLAKDALTRVRASRHYGQRNLVPSLTERLQAVTRCLEETKGNGDAPVARKCD